MLPSRAASRPWCSKASVVVSTMRPCATCGCLCASEALVCALTRLRLMALTGLRVMPHSRQSAVGSWKLPSASSTPLHSLCAKQAPSTVAAAHLRAQGFLAPGWDTSEHAPCDLDHEELPHDWQRQAAAACDEHALEMHLSDLDGSSRISSAAALAGWAACGADLYHPAQFRILLLRRLTPLKLQCSLIKVYS